MKVYQMGMVFLASTVILAAEPCDREKTNFCQRLSGQALMECLQKRFSDLAPKCQRSLNTKDSKEVSKELKEEVLKKKSK